MSETVIKWVAYFESYTGEAVAISLEVRETEKTYVLSDRLGCLGYAKIIRKSDHVLYDSRKEAIDVLVRRSAKDLACAKEELRLAEKQLKSAEALK